MKEPLLSICIATYNRAGYIGQTLDSIIPQLADDMELLVVDGASTDNTEDVVRTYVDAHSRIHYVRLPAKGGVDQDYSKSVELAHGEFCWLFTDDDLLKPGAVATVKAAIDKGYGLIVVNAEVRDSQLATRLERQRIGMQENKTYHPDNQDRLFVDAWSLLSFIGSVVIRRSIWLSRDRESYFGTEFVHIGVIFQKPLLEPALLIAEPHIIIRYGNAQWSPRSFDIWMFKWPKLVWSFEHIPDQVKQGISQQEPWRKLKTLILQRGRGAYTAEHYNDRFAALNVSRLWKVGAYYISRFPTRSLAYLLSNFCRLTRQHNILLRYDFDQNLKG